MKSFIVNIILKLGNVLGQFQLIYRKHKILQNKSIILSKNVYIHPTARLETIDGGKIVIGEGTQILHGVLLITYGGDIQIGKHCKINPYTIIYGLGGLKIMDDVLIAGHCMIVPDNHKFDDLNIKITDQGTIKKGILINQNTWIGHACTILDGVEIESGAIVAAGSVVTKNVLKNTIVAGVPAKLIKTRT